MVLFHGTNCKVKKPELERSRHDIDFGAGFYLTERYELAAKWACRKNLSVVNQYKIEINSLKIHTFGLDKTWLDFVVGNRNMDPIPGYDKYDVLIGPIADDKLYSIIEMYESDFISAENAIKIMDCMHYGNQVVLKSQASIDNVVFMGCKELQNLEKQEYIEKYKKDKQEATKRTEEMLKRINRGEEI